LGLGPTPTPTPTPTPNFIKYKIKYFIIKYCNLLIFIYNKIIKLRYIMFDILFKIYEL